MDAGTRLSAGLYIFSRSACSMAGAGHASCHSLYRLVYNIYESCQRKYSFIDNDKAVFPLARFVNIIYQSESCQRKYSFIDNDIADKFHTPDHSPASVYLYIFRCVRMGLTQCRLLYDIDTDHTAWPGSSDKTHISRGIPAACV